MSDAFHGDVLAEETHSGRAWSLIILLTMMGPMIGVALVPSPVGRWALALVGILSIGAFGMAWSGFQYRFLRHGVEIRMLGFRLRSIPKQSIVSYSIEPWAFIRGYGIRGIGSTRAYVGATPLYTSGLRPARFSWGTAIRSGSSGTWIW